MIVDSSAIIAILLKEPEGAAFARVILAEADVRISAATYVELVNVIDRRVGQSALAEFDEFLNRAEIAIVPFTVSQAEWARHARLTYGRGRSPAGLNFGDCFAYALAKETGEPLLFKGDDFAGTDLVPAF